MSWLIANHIDRGLAAARPAANAVPGKHWGWFATDTGVLSISDGSSWIDIGPGGGAVDSVFTRTGNVVAASGDYTAAQVTNVPAGGIAAVTVQAALNELDTEKLASGAAAGGVLSGTYPNPGFAVDMATQAELDAHITDTSGAHAASAIANTPAGTISATDVQAAINELDSEKAATGAVPSFATPAIVLGSSAAAGAAGTVIRSDGTIAAFDATNPSTQAFGDAAAVGSAAFAARRDHKHAMPADPFTGAAAGGDLNGTYPNPLVDAGLFGGTGWTTIRKTSDTGRSGTTTVAIDPELAATLSSGVLYEVQLVVLYVSTAGAGTPDLKCIFCEDATSRGSMFGFGFSAAEAAGLQSQPARSSSPFNAGTAATNRGYLIWGTYLGNGAGAGLFWAQNTSDANNTSVLTGSVMRYRAIS